jgi:NADH-quinone oxidoreductase subunit E
MFVFNETNLAKIETLKCRYPSPNALVLPLLWMVQEQEELIPLEAMETVGEIAEVPAMEVYRVATFYTMFNLESVGTYHLQVCKTLSCRLCGAQEIVDHLKSVLGIEVGETTADGRFTLSQVECLGSCGTGPVLQVNETYYEGLNIEQVDRILEMLR